MVQSHTSRIDSFGQVMHLVIWTGLPSLGWIKPDAKTSAPDSQHSGTLLARLFVTSIYKVNTLPPPTQALTSKPENTQALVRASY